MTTDPWAGHPSNSGPYAYPDESVTPRTSMLAIASLVFGLLCCIPGPGAIAVVCGAFALAAISKSGQRLEGRTLAVVGMVLGMIGSMIWVGVIVGGAALIRATKMNILEPTITLMQAINKQDWAAARAAFKPGLVVSDAQIAQFRDDFITNLGGFKGLAQQLDFAAAARIMSGNGPSSPSNIQVGPGQIPIPLPIPYSFDKSPAIVVLVVDKADVITDALFNGKPITSHIVNIVIVREGAPPQSLLPLVPSTSPTSSPPTGTPSGTPSGTPPGSTPPPQGTPAPVTPPAPDPKPPGA